MSRPRILIVDDKPNNLRLCRDILGDQYVIETANNGEEAVEKLDADEFDVVLTDIRMPLLDGRKLLDLIQQRGLATQVILMTAYGSIEDAVDAMRAGAVHYLSKPFDPEVLERTVAEALARGAHGAAGGPPPADAPRPLLDPTFVSYREALTHARERTSQEYLTTLLTFCEGNVTRAADLAGVERESLHRLMRRYGIRAEDFRPRPREGGPEDGDPEE